ncbi:YopX family protein [Bacillus amyloliquefaciens]|uniref:YopX family protein n=1 Tax=Bacillus amyloliquefaciens TaxID=1390 RepID=UPI00209E249A|nr:YopX family protein [Bacillus amyloliquefaciens]MCP1459526.1 putative phage protein (TIGR01671 family) [Bacillus amyloliquefaciens]
MREIKFRAYHTEERDGQEFPRMIDWDEILNNDEEELACYFRNEFSNVSPLMQYTGLKDKYHREIYEGDIILEHNTDTKFVVKYDNRHASYYLDLGIGDDAGAFMVGDLEIIGNIYENPGLLKTE